MGKRKQLQQFLHTYASPHLLFIIVFGFASGLPLSLTGSSLQAWFTVSGASLMTIGVLETLVASPYTYKFIWAPILDRFSLPWLGRRRDWVLASQILIIIALLLISNFKPDLQPWIIGSIALGIALFSATQDIAVDAYRTEILGEEERGYGAGLFVFGYRMAMLVSGGLAFIMADHIGWPITYRLMAMIMGIGVLASIFAPNPQLDVKPPTSMKEAIWLPMKDYFSRSNAVLVLLFIILYKFGDALALSLSTTFFIRGVGFSLTEIGTVSKIIGLIATIFGGIFGGVLMMRIGLFRALLLFGLLQGVSNLSFMLLSIVGKKLSLLVLAILLENITGGMGSAAFIAFLMSMCNPRFTAFQYALLSAFAAVGRVFVGPLAAHMVETFGWTQFFLLSFFISLPALIILCWLKRRPVFTQKTWFVQAS